MNRRISSLILLLAASGTTSAAPAPHGVPAQGLQQQGGQQPLAALNADLVPEFGVVPSVNADTKQLGSCDGFNGEEIVLIPCFCPPDRSLFLQKVNDAVSQGTFFGDTINFSNDAADQSEETNKARATALIVVLQSFNGTKGVGCPGASAPNFISQQRTGVRIDGTFVA